MRVLVFCIAIAIGLTFSNTSQAQEQLDSHQNKIDDIVSKQLSLRGNALSPQAEKEVLIRRVCLSVTGRLPKSESVQSFVQNPRPDAYLQFVDECLDSPEFAERTALEWLLTAQYADQIAGLPKNPSHVASYRDWVVSSIHQNQPIDQFVLWQLAGDMLPDALDQQRLATAFLRLGDPLAHATERNAVQGAENAVDSRMEQVARAMLGSDVQCARCHHSPQSSISHQEYKQFARFFGNVCDGSPVTGTPPATGRSMLLLAAPFQQQQIKALETAIQSVRQTLHDEIEKIESTPSVEKWYTDLVEWPQPKESWLAAEFVFDESSARMIESATAATSMTVMANQVDPGKPASLKGMPQWERVGRIPGVRLDGSNPITFPRVGTLALTDEFSIGMEVQLPDGMTDAAMLYRCNAEIPSEGTQGYALRLEAGHLVFTLAHHRIHSAITVRTKNTIPTNQRTHIGIVCAGSSRADETWIYVNGKRCEVDILQDNLNKDFLVDPSIPMRFGAQDGSPGLAGAVLSHLQIFGVALTEIEMDGLVNDVPLLTWEELPASEQDLWLNHYARREDAQCRYHLESYKHYLQTHAAELRGVPAVFVMDEQDEQSDPQINAFGPRIPKAWLAGEEIKPADRLALAKWLVGKDQMLVARAMANHIWKQMFGYSLRTETADELLEHMAEELVHSGWDRKSLFRSIALSKVFQQRSQSQDTENESSHDLGYLPYYPIHSMHPLVYRDVVLKQAGLMSEQRNWKETKGIAGQTTSAKAFRRSLVASWDQHFKSPLMQRDRDPSQAICTREQELSNPSPDAIEIAEGPTWRTMALAIAWQESQTTNQLDEVIRRIYLALLGRPCTDSELIETQNHAKSLRLQYQNNPQECDAILREGEQLGLEWPTGLPDEKVTIASWCIVIESILLSDSTRLVR